MSAAVCIGKMPVMRLVSAFLLGALVLGCQNESQLDKKTAGGSAVASGDLEARIKKLEADNAKYHDMLEWLQGMYQQQQAKQKQQEEAQAANEPDPNAVFAVDIAPDLKAGQVEGPPTACVTLVEAWDFA